MEDSPQAFGQHPNAEVSSQNANTIDFFGTILQLQPRDSSGEGESPDDIVTRICEDVVSVIREPFDIFTVKEQLQTKARPGTFEGGTAAGA